MYDFSAYEQEEIKAEDLSERLLLLEAQPALAYIVIADKAVIQSYFTGIQFRQYMVKDSAVLNDKVEGTYYGIPFIAQENDGKFSLILMPKESALYQRLTLGVDRRALIREGNAE